MEYERILKREEFGPCRTDVVLLEYRTPGSQARQVILDTCVPCPACKDFSECKNGQVTEK